MNEDDINKAIRVLENKIKNVEDTIKIYINTGYDKQTINNCHEEIFSLKLSICALKLLKDYPYKVQNCICKINNKMDYVVKATNIKQRNQTYSTAILCEIENDVKEIISIIKDEMF